MRVSETLSLFLSTFVIGTDAGKKYHKSTGTGNEVSSGNVVQDNFKDNYGTAKPEYMPVYNSESYEEVRACEDWSEIFMRDAMDGTTNYYPSTKAFSEFKGTDLIPENKDNYLRAPGVGRLYYNNLNFNDARSITPDIKLRSCSVAAKEDGWFWNVQRIGPFESHGNLDWWQVGWHDAFNLRPVLDKYPEGIIVDKHEMVPIEDGTWNRLGNPPIHIHHIHVMADRKGHSVRPRNGFELYNLSLAVEQHGDYQCLEEEGGHHCFLEQNPPGTGRLITSTLDIEGELNDMRAIRSDKLTWWYEIAIRWTPNTKAVEKQISMHFIAGPGAFNMYDQSSYVLTFKTPTKEPTFYWYTGEMWTDGSLVRNKLHGHNSIFHSAYWINAAPHELGLDDPKFMPKLAFVPQFVSELGYESIDSLAIWLLDHLKLPANMNKKEPSRVICSGFVQGEKVDGFYFDRRAPCECSEWEFKKGEPFTVLAFSYHDGSPFGPFMPDTIPETVPSHIHWMMQYINHNTGTSKFGMSGYSQTGEFANSDRRPGIYEKMLILYYGGSIQKTHVDFVNSTPFRVGTGLLYGLLLLCPIVYMYRRFNKKRTAPEKAIDTLVETVYMKVPQTHND